MVYGFVFRSLEYNTAFIVMGCVVICSSFLSIFINIPCHAGLIWGEDNHAVIQARERYMQRVEMARIHQLQATVAGQAGTVDTEGGQEHGSDNIRNDDEDAELDTEIGGKKEESAK